MEHAEGMGIDDPAIVPVIDFRRHSMVLQWHTRDGTWAAYDTPPPLVKGVALIGASQPGICLFAHAGRLRLQIGATQYALSEASTRIGDASALPGFGLRRRFTVESGSGGVLFSYAYWTNQHPDFFRWLAAKAKDPGWRAASGRQWSEGVDSRALRSD